MQNGDVEYWVLRVESWEQCSVIVHFERESMLKNQIKEKRFTNGIFDKQPFRYVFSKFLISFWKDEIAMVTWALDWFISIWKSIHLNGNWLIPMSFSSVNDIKTQQIGKNGAGKKNRWDFPFYFRFHQMNCTCIEFHSLVEPPMCWDSRLEMKNVRAFSDNNNWFNENKRKLNEKI